MDSSLESPGFDQYSLYGAKLHQLLEDRLDTADWQAEAYLHLNGEAYRLLRKLVPLAIRRDASTFFTNSALSEQLVRPYYELIRGGGRVIDPAAGIGDLLIAVVKLCASGDLDMDTILRQITGRELIPALADIARKRIALAGSFFGSGDISYSDREICVEAGDGLADYTEVRNADLVLLNPPYARLRVETSSWGKGLVTNAAPFLLSVLALCKPNARVAAILPDVLRSGPRYVRWRSELDRLAEVETIEQIGPFDRWTDIDVFIIRLRVRGQETSREARSQALLEVMEAPQSAERLLSSIATVSVGDVVPHRHSPSGSYVPYATIAAVPIGARVSDLPRRRFVGRLHEPPFVLLRRTSAPGVVGTPRARTSIVAGLREQVAVENHLLVVKPINTTVASCLALAEALEQPSVSRWLDLRSRTRHLTCGAVRDIPLTILGLDDKEPSARSDR